MRTGMPFFSAITTLTALSASRDPDKEFVSLTHFSLFFLKNLYFFPSLAILHLVR